MLDSSHSAVLSRSDSTLQTSVVYQNNNNNDAHCARILNYPHISFFMHLIVTEDYTGAMNEIKMYEPNEWMNEWMTQS